MAELWLQGRPECGSPSTRGSPVMDQGSSTDSQNELEASKTGP